jgi:hypothetical protein
VRGGCSTCKWLIDFPRALNTGCMLGQRPPLRRCVDISKHYCDLWKESDDVICD